MPFAAGNVWNILADDVVGHSVGAPSPEAKTLIMLALIGYAMASVLYWLTGRRKDQVPTTLTMTTLSAAIALSLGVVVVRIGRGHMPAFSGFDTFAILALLTGAAAAYLRAVNVLGRAGLGLLPLATAWAALALVLSNRAYHAFAPDAWKVMHVALAASATLAAAASAVGGWQYLRKYNQLRSKDPRMFEGPATSLERIGQFLRAALPITWILVTATVAFGLIDFAFKQESYFNNWVTHPKVLTAGITWLLYSLGMHSLYARRFRARVAAMLALVGFALLVAVLVAAMLLPQTMAGPN